jgi:hypothetical protein
VQLINLHFISTSKGLQPQATAMSNLTYRQSIMDELASWMAKLLHQEDDWDATASSLRDRALDDGLDLHLRYDSREMWARDLLDNLGFHVDFVAQWPNGVPEFSDCSAEDLFWQMISKRQD